MTGNHFLHTPEALLGRQDSKNPATTCRGLTSTGRPCRRALAAGKSLDHGEQVNGVIALLKKGDQIGGAQYYCWQHKEQAQSAGVSATTMPTHRQTEILELKNKSSIDTLVQRLGIETEQENRAAERQRRQNRATGKYNSTPGSPSRPQHARSKQHSSIWRSLCCMFAVDPDDTIEIIRHKKRVEQGRVAGLPIRQRPPQKIHTHDEDSPLSLIPTGTSPQIACALLAELSKPISIHDEEGYIYIFWLTPSEQQGPSEETARSLLSAPQERSRRLSDVLTEYSYSGRDYQRTSTRQPQTILLKIGRANNVTRRMNEWQRQCGHRLNLIRWYPHTPSSAAPSPLPSPRETTERLYPDLSQHNRPSTARKSSSSVRKVPNVKRVERLIHLELAEKQAKQTCAACGREHREWFEVQASEAGVRSVDAIVRRWAEWSERIAKP